MFRDSIRTPLHTTSRVSDSCRCQPPFDSVLAVEDEKFTFMVDGFDEHRDLLVRIDELTEDDAVKEVD